MLTVDKKHRGKRDESEIKAQEESYWSLLAKKQLSTLRCAYVIGYENFAPGVERGHDVALIDQRSPGKRRRCRTIRSPSPRRRRHSGVLRLIALQRELRLPCPRPSRAFHPLSVQVPADCRLLLRFERGLARVASSFELVDFAGV